MITQSRYLEAPRRLRAFVRAYETSLVVLAAMVGAIGGLVVSAMGAAVEVLHVVLFNLDAGDRLSSQLKIEPLRALLVPSLGGLLLGVAFLQKKQLEPAAAAFRQSVTMNPELARGHRALGETLLYQDKPDDAIAELRGLLRRLLVYAQSPRLTTASSVEVLGFDALLESLQRGRL